MNIALIGHGRTGKEIERIAIQRKIAVKQVFTSKNNKNGKGITGTSLKGIDVCIDFSAPESVLANIRAVAACRKNLVVGTTGWQKSLGEVKKLVTSGNIGFLYAPNFSVGMNVFASVLSSALRSFNKFDEYDVAIHEIHHRDKTDSPSGTALMLSAIVLEEFKKKKTILSEMVHQAVQPGQLHVTSSRLGNVAGTHKILFDSAADSIELIHTAKNQSGFALGAVIAAEWLNGKKGFYTMKDLLASL
jgi:4-hydroxy-tetrahydrodipicolinate reductase